MSATAYNFSNLGSSAPFFSSNNPCAVYYLGVTYIVFQGGDSNDPYITSYTHLTDTWVAPVKVAENPLGLGDYHGGPVMHIDPSGYIHVYYGAHVAAGDLHHSKSNNPLDISAWTAQPAVASTVSYPQILEDPTNSSKVYLLLRDGTTTWSWETIRTSNDGGDTFGAPTTLIDFGNNHCVYSHMPQIYGTKISFVWRIYVAPNQLGVVYYAYYNLLDGHMYSITGTDLGVAINEAEADTNCIVKDEGANEVNHVGMHLDSTGKPYIIHIVFAPDASHQNIRFTRWTGAAWSVTETITTTDSSENIGDFIIHSPTSITYYGLSGAGGTDNNVEQWSWDGSLWIKDFVILTEDTSGKQLSEPKVPVNYNSDLPVVFAEQVTGTMGLKLYAYLFTVHPSTFVPFAIDGIDYSANLLRAELWRTVNAVGSWMAVLRNPAGTYNGVFDVQQSFILGVNGSILMEGETDGPAVLLRGRDLESIWDEYVVLRGVDQAQDLLFHNDFEHDYPDINQEIKTVLNDIFNVHLAGLPIPTNITYAVPGGATPVIGATEFREGTSFIGTLQEIMRSAGYIFYVDDSLALQSGTPGFSAAPIELKSIAGDPTNNILDVVDLQERDGDKHYNYVKLYSKSTMIDGYTELNAGSWRFVPAGQGLDWTASHLVGLWSQVTYNNNPVNSVLSHYLSTVLAPEFNYTSWDFTSGEIGIWAKYDDTAGAPGTPGVGAAGDGLTPFQIYVECELTDGAGNNIRYFGDSTRLFRGEWGSCTFPLGEQVQPNIANVINNWTNMFAGFNWDDVREIRFNCPNLVKIAIGLLPSHFYIDGISLPIPCISIAENPAAQLTYRKRPYIDSFNHIRTQNALDAKANQLRTQFETTLINKIKLVTVGSPLLRYAGQTITLTIPSLGLNDAIFYMTEIHHIIEPYIDVSQGFGFDWITEVEAVPVSGVAFDKMRLRDGPAYSSNQTATRIGMGARMK